jgi:hypothetical protein
MSPFLWPCRTRCHANSIPTASSHVCQAFCLKVGLRLVIAKVSGALAGRYWTGRAIAWPVAEPSEDGDR